MGGEGSKPRQTKANQGKPRLQCSYLWTQSRKMLLKHSRSNECGRTSHLFQGQKAPLTCHCHIVRAVCIRLSTFWQCNESIYNSDPWVLDAFDIFGCIWYKSHIHSGTVSISVCISHPPIAWNRQGALASTPAPSTSSSCEHQTRSLTPTYQDIIDDIII